MNVIEESVNTAFESRQVPLLKRLVEQPSCSREPEDVETAALILDEAAEAIGLRGSRRPDPESRFADHRVYETQAAGEVERCLSLVGHIDTVFPRSMGFVGFRRDGDTAFGPGVLDMKSGLTSIFLALAALDDRHDIPIRVVVVSDEEVGSPSSTALYRELAPSTSAALVFEAGRAEDAIVTARKGTGAFVVEVKGRSAHSGLNHADGVNAIAALAHVVTRIEALTDYTRGVTFNVGLIEGGTSTNTVPAEASCRIDARFVEPEHGAHVVELLRDAVLNAELPNSLSPAKLSLGGSVHRPPMVPTPASRRLLFRYAEKAAAVGLGSAEAPLQGGGSDANLLAALGVPCIDGLGPAGEGIHRTTEQCSLSSLRRRTAALAMFLAEWRRRPLP